MQEPLSISSNETLPISQDYAALKELGMELLPKLAGELWTDYNEHDPGVTILEQICYAMTELGYRTSLPVRNLLTKKDGSLPLTGNALFPPPEIFPSDPLTIRDFQLILEDLIPEVKHAWLDPILHAGLPNGLYVVWIEARRDHGHPNLAEELMQVLQGMRNWGEFILSVSILQPVYFSPEAKTGMNGIYLSPQADPNQIFAQSWFDIEQHLSPPTPFQSLDSLLEAGYSTDQIYEGPLLQRGFISPTYDPPAKLTQISSADIQNILSGIAEIEEIIGLSLKPLRSGKVSPEKVITLRPISNLEFRLTAQKIKEISNQLNGKVPIKAMKSLTDQSFQGKKAFTQAMQKAIIKYSELDPGQPFWDLLLNASFQSPLQFFQGGKLASLVYTKIDQAYKDLWQAFTQKDSLDLDDNSWSSHLPKGRYVDVGSYYSLQHQFPALYGLAKDDIPPEAPAYRQAQVRQLKGYLLVFEQFLANYLAQLAGLRSFFSTNEETRTYFFQDLYEVPEVARLLKGFYRPELDHIDPLEFDKFWKAYKANPANPYLSGLARLVEGQEPFLDRKSRIYAHILARFAEQLPAFVPSEPLSPHLSSSWIKNFPRASRQRGRARTAEDSFFQLLLLSFSEWVVNRQSIARRMIQRGTVSGLQFFFNSRFERYNWDGFMISSLFRDEKGNMLPAASESDILINGTEYTSYEIKEEQEGWLMTLRISEDDGNVLSYTLPPIYVLHGPNGLSRNIPKEQLYHLDEEDAEAYRDFVLELIRMMPKGTHKHRLPAQYPGIPQGMIVIDHIQFLPRTGWYIKEHSGKLIASSLPLQALISMLNEISSSHSQDSWETGVVLPDGSNLPSSFFSSQLTLVIPSYSPMDQPAFQQFVLTEVLKRIPAHIFPHILFLSPEQTSILIERLKQAKEEKRGSQSSDWAEPVLKWLKQHVSS